MFLDHKAIPVNNFGGLYGRDSYADSVPLDHFIDSLNTITEGHEVKTRNGFGLSVTLANLRRAFVYKREGEASRLLLLNGSNQLFDATASLVIPILTVTGMTDFSIIQIYNRCYITPHNGVKGLSGEFTYVYQGTGTARKAAGVAPIGAFTPSISATAGNVEPGTHIFNWVYETDTGFLTKPGTAVTLETDGTKCVSFTNVPVGPSGTAKRKLIASRAIQSYNGDPDGYEMFFVPTGIIADNSTTTLSNIDFFDADLQVSADYLYDQLEEIPSCVFLSRYGNKLAFGGSNANPSLVYISKEGEPESINSLAGFVTCDPTEAEGVKNAVEYRNAFYITKNGKTYITQSNGLDPSTWAFDTVDFGIGADVNGISVFLDSRGANSDKFLVADVSGLFIFNGGYDLAFPLSLKIKNWWDRINKAAFNKCQVVIDSKKFRIYVNVPLDSATTPSHIIVGDYSNGLDWQNIRWHLWSFASFAAASILVDIDSTTKKSVFKVAAYAGNIYKEVDDQRHDENVAISNYIQFALLYLTENWVHHVAGIGLRINGSGTLSISGYPLGLGSSTTLPSLSLNATSAQYFEIPTIIQDNEKCSIKISLNASGSYFKLREFILYSKPLWASRPY